MDNNDSSLKPQQTGGLKLMTVFIAVLALHVVVIGGFTVYHLMSGGSTDADLVTDKTHKDVKVSPDSATVSDGPLPDSGMSDKSAQASSPTADTAGTPMTIPAPTPAPDATAVNPPSTPPALTTAPTPPAPVTQTASAPPVPSGPVITPPAVSPAPEASAPEVAADSANAPAITPEPVGSGATYTVKAHDTLARIAHRTHVSVARLRAANGGIKTAMLHAGEKLNIPAPTKETPTNLAGLREPNTTILGDDAEFSKPSAKALKVSGNDEADMAPATGSRHTYTVVKGDTLNRIARKFHTSSTAIMALNNISDARKLRLGQKLRIPSQEARSANSVPAATHEEDRIEPRATPTAQLANFLP
jgi:LysM repeat protein